jgi:hypothetical protein
VPFAHPLDKTAGDYDDLADVVVIVSAGCLRDTASVIERNAGFRK